MGNRQCGVRDEQGVSGEWSVVRGDERTSGREHTVAGCGMNRG